MARRVVIRHHRQIVIITVLVFLALGAFLWGFVFIGFVRVNDRILLFGQTGEPRFQFCKVDLCFQQFFLAVERNADKLLRLFQVSFQLRDLCIAVLDCFLNRAVKKLTMRCQLSAFAALPSGIE